jgi:hypothetical protein
MAALGDVQPAEEVDAAEERADGEQNDAQVELLLGLQRHVARHQHRRAAG